MTPGNEFDALRDLPLRQPGTITQSVTSGLEGIVELERLSGRQFEQFSNLIYRLCGVRIDEKKVTLLSNRVRRRVRVGGFAGFDAYFAFLTSAKGTSELESFLDEITTNETFFFRTPKQFEWFEADFLGDMIVEHRAGRRPASLRIWSAGCATGAEPYSIAIKLLENQYRLRDWSLYVLGSDISEQALRAARDGVYQSRAVELVTERQRVRFFDRSGEDNLWRLRPHVKELVEFRRHNLMQPMAQARFDCVFIRNVLIYFDRESKQVVINHLLHALADEGYLVVGPSEGVFDMLRHLHRISPLVYQKSTPPKRGSLRAIGGETS